MVWRKSAIKGVIDLDLKVRIISLPSFSNWQDISCSTFCPCSLSLNESQTYVKKEKNCQNCKLKNEGAK